MDTIIDAAVVVYIFASVNHLIGNNFIVVFLSYNKIVLLTRPSFHSCRINNVIYTCSLRII
jgi:hypothetical protein